MRIRYKFKEFDKKQNVTGFNINRYRNKLNMSAQQLSNQLILNGLELSSSAIYKIESGKRIVTDYELYFIADILNITTDELLRPFDEIVKKSK